MGGVRPVPRRCGGAAELAIGGHRLEKGAGGNAVYPLSQAVEHHQRSIGQHMDELFKVLAKLSLQQGHHLGPRIAMAGHGNHQWHRTGILKQAMGEQHVTGWEWGGGCHQRDEDETYGAVVLSTQPELLGTSAPHHLEHDWFHGGDITV